MTCRNIAENKQRELLLAVVVQYDLKHLNKSLFLQNNSKLQCLSFTLNKIVFVLSVPKQNYNINCLISFWPEQP